MVLTRGISSMFGFLLLCSELLVTTGDPAPGSMVLCEYNPRTKRNFPSLSTECTHGIYFGGSISHLFLEADPKVLKNVEADLQGLVDKKKKDPHFKVLYQLNSILYDGEKIRIFAKNITRFLLANNVDGLLLKTYMHREKNATDIPVGIYLVKKLKEEMGKENLIFMYQLNECPLDDSFSQISDIIDYFVLNDILFTEATSRTIPKSPIWNTMTVNSIETSVSCLLSKRIPLNKAILSLSFTGTMFLLLEKSQGVFGETATGTYSLSYQKICPMIKNATRYWDRESRTPLIAFDREVCLPYFFQKRCVGPYSVVAYEDPESLVEKVQYVKKHQLGGFYVPFLVDDDIEGKCGERKQPLMNALISEIHRSLPTGV